MPMALKVLRPSVDLNVARDAFARQPFYRSLTVRSTRATGRVRETLLRRIRRHGQTPSDDSKRNQSTKAASRHHACLSEQPCNLGQVDSRLRVVLRRLYLSEPTKDSTIGCNALRNRSKSACISVGLTMDRLAPHSNPAQSRLESRMRHLQPAIAKILPYCPHREPGLTKCLYLVVGSSYLISLGTVGLGALPIRLKSRPHILDCHHINLIRIVTNPACTPNDAHQHPGGLSV